MSDDGRIFLPYQTKWVRDDAQVKVIEKSRRIGISWASAAGAVVDASEEDPTDCWYVGYNKEMALEYIRDGASWARALEAECDEIEDVEIFDEDEDKAILAYRIRFASGGRITALSSRPSNLRGKQGHVFIDEAAFHDDLPGLRKAAMAVLMWGGKVSIASTHNGAHSAFNALVEDCRAGRFDYSLHRVTFDDALEEGLYERIAEIRGLPQTPEARQQWRQEMIELYGDDADEELFCIPAKSGGIYIAPGLVERAMEPGEVIRLSLPDDFKFETETARGKVILEWCKTHLDLPLKRLDRQRLHFLGEDFGRISDLTVLAPFVLVQDTSRRAPFLVELRNVPFENQKQIAFYLCDRLPRFTKAALDATGNGAYLAEVMAQRYGELRVEEIKMTAGWYAENLPAFKAAHEEGTLAYPKDADVLDDVCAFEVIDGLPRLPKAKRKGSDGAYRHGDAGIALVLGHYASKMQAVEFDYEGAKTGKLTKDSRGRTKLPRRKGML